MPDVEEIEVTPEMIEAGMVAWRESGGDEFPGDYGCTKLVMTDIAASQSLDESRRELDHLQPQLLQTPSSGL
jgi:hypothetical protein